MFITFYFLLFSSINGLNLSYKALFLPKSCIYTVAAEQKARTTYENLMRLAKDPEVYKVLKFLREREIVHFQRFGEALEFVRADLNKKNYYAYNPAFDK